MTPTEEKRKRIHGITYSTDDREELAERIVELEDENARLRSCLSDDAENARQIMAENAKLREQVTQLQDDWESERDYADQMEAKEKKAVGENDKLRELVAHLMYVKPNDVNAILHKGKLLRFDDLLAEVGMRWESEVE